MNDFNFWDFLWDFLVMTVVVKAIAAHWVAQQVKKGWKKLIGSTDRYTAIWAHYQERAKGHGHQNDDVTHCRQGNCVVFS